MATILVAKDHASSNISSCMDKIIETKENIVYNRRIYLFIMLALSQALWY